MKFKCPHCGKIIYPVMIKNGNAFCECPYCNKTSEIDLNDRERE